MSWKERLSKRRRWLGLSGIVFRESRRLLRVGVALSVCLSILVWVALRVSVAKVDRQLMALSKNVSLLTESGLVDDGRRLEINGGRLRLSLSVEPGRLGDWQTRLSEQCQNEVDDWKHPLVRQGRDGSYAYVACLVPNRGLRSLEEGVAAMAQEESLAALGHYRFYSLAQVADSVRVVRIDAGEGLDLLAMFPEEGDAPGLDLPGLPRPTATRRILSVVEVGNPSQVAIYSSRLRKKTDLLRFYRRYFEDSGDAAIISEQEMGDQKLLYARRGEVVYAVSAQELEGEVILSVALSR